MADAEPEAQPEETPAAEPEPAAAAIDEPPQEEVDEPPAQKAEAPSQLAGTTSEPAPESSAPQADDSPDREIVDETNIVDETEEIHERTTVRRLVLYTFNNKYYWETFKSAVLFIIGLKLAQECYHMVVPIKEYEPFHGFCSGRCR